MLPSWRVADSAPIPPFSPPDIHPLVIRLLAARGVVDGAAIRHFLTPDYRTQTHDPFLFDDMKRSVERIIRALSSRELIAIYGDYDVDGLSASTLLFDVLTLFGGRVTVHINHRERDGYGLCKPAISALADAGATLMITTDSGISNAKEIAFANTRGIDVIITDHHTVPQREEDIPPAFAILHPRVRADRYPFKHLSGGGVAFKLVQALIKADFDPDFSTFKKTVRSDDGKQIHWEAYEKWLLDLVCISTIGDCMPLVGENRVFVHFGLLVLAKTKRLGLQSLLANVRSRIKEYSPYTVGFLIGPRLNAASRMEHGKIAFDLLTSREDSAAVELAATLEQKNIDRQKLTERICAEAKEQLREKQAAGVPILVGYSAEWPIGLLGLVAGRISSWSSKPVVLITTAHGTRAGAGRSPDYFHLTNCFAQVSSYFDRYGGHAAAGGFALKVETSLEAFITDITAIAREMIGGLPTAPTVMIDACVQLSDLTLELVGQLKRLEPHGHGNPKPSFFVSGATVISANTVGATGKHLRMMIQQSGLVRKVIGFGLGDRAGECASGSRIDCIVHIEENEWNGMREVQLTLRDFHCVHTELQPVQLAKAL